jgi:hypothetical protein
MPQDAHCELASLCARGGGGGTRRTQPATAPLRAAGSRRAASAHAPQATAAGAGCRAEPPRPAATRDVTTAQVRNSAAAAADPGGPPPPAPPPPPGPAAAASGSSSETYDALLPCCVPLAAVARFVWGALRALVPPPLLGDAHNRQ